MKILKFNTGPLSVNTYLSYDEESNEGFLVDPGGESPEIKKFIDQNIIQLKYIILTHGHLDHIGGVDYFKKLYPDTIVVAHKDEEPMLSDGVLNMSTEFFGYEITAKADLFVSHDDTLSVGGSTLKIIHTPGHSPGGMCILMGKTLFSGDTLFRFSVGRTDFAGCSAKKLIESIKNKLFVLDDDVLVLPGHMEETSIGDEKRGNPFI